jgi:hypothetical protein
VRGGVCQDLACPVALTLLAGKPSVPCQQPARVAATSPPGPQGRSADADKHVQQAIRRWGCQSDNPDENKPGLVLVLVLLNPNRRRDRSHFELFPYCHQTFYQQVEVTPAARRSPAGPSIAVCLGWWWPGPATPRRNWPRTRGRWPEPAAAHARGDQGIDLIEALWKLSQQPEQMLQY